MAAHESIVLGGGCFWCLEAAYQQIRGVTEVVPGYAGGEAPAPTYAAVCTGSTGHAEVVRVTFDPAVIPLADILDVFWAMHDPTTPNRQGADVGTQYRSIILTIDDQQQQAAEQSRAAALALWPHPIVTEIRPLDRFYEAESDHHNYFQDHPERAYCQVVINPKLQQLRQKFQQLLV